MWDVMDLCLMCKGCKAECPSNVDVAKLKVEFLAHYYAQHRPATGTVFMANVAWLNRIGSALAPFSNIVAGMPGISRLTQWATGVDHRRTLPRFVSRNFVRWFARHEPHIHAGRSGRVVLLDDCLTSYCEPQINQAAVQLVERAGFAVERVGLWCCGRPFISKGLVETGKSLARRNVARLVEDGDRGIPVLGAEPSCLLRLGDE